MKNISSKIIKIPMLDLYKQYKSIKKDIDSAIKEAVINQSYIGGPHVEQLENNISKFCKTKYAVGLNSGTDALNLSLWSLGIGKGDEVITTPFTFIATAEVISLRGAKPVFVDIDPDNFIINENSIEEKITNNTKAIIPVHLFGQMVNMDKLMRISKKYNINIIEDACQAIGAKYKQYYAGSIGTTGCFSFYPTKNLGAYGDAGMVTTNNKAISDKIRILRNHGCIVKYQNEILGVSSRLDAIQANILLAKLKYLDKWNKRRKEIAKLYNERLSNINYIQTPFESENAYHIYHQYTIRVKNNKRDVLKYHLKNNGVDSMIYYPKPLHLLKAMEYLKYKKGDFPNAEKASREVLSLPMYPELTDKEIEYVCNVIKGFK